MKKKFDFYSPINLKSYNLDLIIRYQLDILGKLDPFTKGIAKTLQTYVVGYVNI